MLLPCLLRALRRDGYDVAARRVETADEMRTALASKSWNVVLADYNLPRFSGLEAYLTLADSTEDLPFIIVCGGIGERFNISPIAVRLIFVLAGLFMPILVPAAYLLAWFFIPVRPDEDSESDGW